VYVWTLGIEGVGDGADKLVTIDANPASPQYGKVIATLSVGSRGEAHHMGFTDDRRYLWAGGLDDNRIFVFDIRHRPGETEAGAHDRRTWSKKTGLVGPHTFYALPGRMLVQACPTQGPRRRHRHGGLQQPGPLIQHDPMATGKGRATATATTSPSTRRRT
jgi:selenium-binding protein 1